MKCCFALCYYNC